MNQQGVSTFSGKRPRWPLLTAIEPNRSTHNMKIQVNTDAHIEGRDALSAWVNATVEHALQHVHDQVTRVEVHLSDQNGSKSSQKDKRCVMEARLEGRQPIAATNEAASLDQAVRGAADKLARLIDSQLGRVASSDRSPVKPPAE
jgi:ribosome-associated translation inhibitor RaiA